MEKRYLFESDVISDGTQTVGSSSTMTILV